MARRSSVLPTLQGRGLGRRLLRLGWKVLRVLLAILLILAGIAALVLFTETGSGWAVRRVVQSIDEGIPGSIDFDYAGGTLLGNVRVANVVIRDPAGYEVIRVAEASARIDLPLLLEGHVRFTEVRARGVQILVRQRKAYVGIVRAFVEPLEPGALPAPREPGTWLFDLPDIRLRDVRVRVDLASAAVAVSVPSMEAAVFAGRGAHRVRTRSSGTVAIERVGGAPRDERVEFLGTVASRAGMPVDAELRLRESGDGAVTRFAMDESGFHAVLRGTSAGIDLDRYLAGVAPDLRLGRARDLDTSADGPLEDLAFRLAAATDAGALELSGRMVVRDERRLLTALARLDRIRPVRLGWRDAPPELAISAAAAIHAELDVPSVEAALSEVAVDGIDVPGGAQTGTFHADPRRVALRLDAGDHSFFVSAALQRGEESDAPWQATAEGRLEDARRVELPWLAATGPLDLSIVAELGVGGLQSGTLAATLGGTLQPGAVDAVLRGAWSTSLDARSAGEGGGWIADGWLLGAAGAELRAGETVVAGPVRRADPAPGDPAGAPVHVEVDADGTLRLALERLEAASVADESRGARSTAPLVADVRVARATNGSLSVQGTLASAGTLELGPADAVRGPFLASAEAEATGGEWRLVRAAVDAAGARYGGVRTGVITAALAPTAGGGASHVRATVAGVRSGRTAVGTVSVDLVGDTTAGGGTVRLAGTSGSMSTTVHVRRDEGTGVVDFGLEGGLIRTETAALRFRGSVRAGPAGLEIPALIVEGQGASGRVAGRVPGWRRLALEGRLDGLPLASLFDFLPVPLEAREAVAAGRVSVQVTAAGTVARPLVDFRASVDGVEALGLRDTHAEVLGRLDGPELRVSARSQLSTGGSIAADVTSMPDAGVTVYVQADEVPLAILERLRPGMPAVAGMLDDGSLLFVADEQAIEARITVRDFAVGELAPVDGWIDLTCSERRCTDRFRITGLGGGTVEGDGRLALLVAPTEDPARAVEGFLHGQWLQHVAFAGVEPAAVGVGIAQVPSGTYSGSAVLVGEPSAPRGRAELEAQGVGWGAGRENLPPLGARLVVLAGEDSLRATAGVFNPGGDASQAVVEWAAGVTALLQDPAAFLKPDIRAAGRLSGELLSALVPGGFAHDGSERLGFRVRWTPAESGGTSAWSLAVSGERPSLGEVPVRSGFLSIDGAGLHGEVRASVRAGEAIALQLRGEVELPAAPPREGRPAADPENPARGDAFPDLAAFAEVDPAGASVDARIFAEGLNLAGLPGPAVVADLSGTADLDLTVRGPVTAPEILGTFHIVDGGFVLVPTAQRFEQIELTGAVDPGTVRISRLSVASGGGTASGSGTVEFGTVGGLGGTFHLDSDEFPLSGEGAVFGRLSCALDVSAAVLTVPYEATGARRVDGHVNVGRCTLVLPRQRSQAVMPMEDHPDFLVAGREESRAGAASDEPSAPWDMAITVDVPGEFSVRREDLQMTGTGNLFYRSTPSRGEAASVGGNIEMRRGWADLFGKRFDLDFGDVEFTGRNPIDGTIDLRLVAQTTEGPVYVDVTGTLRHPAVQLTSDPPRDQSEILALLFLGRTDVTSQEQLAIGQRSAAVAQDVVTTVGLAYFQSQVASQISPLTVFRIDPGAQGLEDARLRAGVNVLSNLYVEYSYQFAADDLQNKNEGRVEWLILRNLSLEGNFGDAQAGGIHLQFRTEW